MPNHPTYYAERSEASQLGVSAGRTVCVTPRFLALQVRNDGLYKTSLAQMDGIQATALLQHDEPDIRVVILNLHDDAQTRAQARSAGAVAFVAKHEPSEVLFDAVRGAVTA